MYRNLNTKVDFHFTEQPKTLKFYAKLNENKVGSNLISNLIQVPIQQTKLDAE